MVAAQARGDVLDTAVGKDGRVEQVGENFISEEIAHDVDLQVLMVCVQQVLPKGSLKSA
jgi:preprotein translocase subunit YajC